MNSKNNRLLMLLVGVAIAGCGSQTQRTSSGPGETQYERVGGTSNAVTQEELQRRAAAAEAVQQAQAPAPAPEPAAAPAAKPAPAASTAAKDEALPAFPITNEGPEQAATAEAAKDEEVEDLGPQADESASEPQEATAESESSVGETTMSDDDGDNDGDESAEVEDLGPQADDSVSEAQDEAAPAESSVGETTMNDDGDNDADESAEVEDLGPQADDSVSEAQDEAAPAESSVGETTAYADGDDNKQPAEESAEVEDLGPQADESVSQPQGPATPPEKTVSEPTVFPDEPVVVAQAKPAPAPVPARTVTVNFETDPLFNFDKYEVRGDQRSKLDEFISSLNGTQYDSIAVVGHTDRIGKDAYNQKLSERRAQAVKDYMVSKGVPAGKIQNAGHGKAEPVSGYACDKVRARKKLIVCLQPDRRVEVSVTATKK